MEGNTNQKHDHGSGSGSGSSGGDSNGSSFNRLVQSFTRDGIEIEILPYQNDNEEESHETYNNTGGAPLRDTTTNGLRHQSHTQNNQNASTSAKVDESLGTTIITEIQQAEYICLVCTGEIDQDSKVWSCQECFRVYDLDCIKDWAIRGSSTNKINKTWRCPSCNYESKKLPSKFTCWCGKVKNPEKNKLMPFSCGNLCNYKYPNCIHRCLNTCHPGKHPVCGANGPLMKCHCGKEKRQVPCIITPYKKGWKCETECNKKLCDLGHKCKKGCHGGSCGKCPKKIEYKCYCGDTKLKGKCSKRTPIECVGFDGKKKWIGGGSCGKRKKYYYECGEHYKVLDCQPPPNKANFAVCIYSPDVISSCYCGKTKMSVGNTRTKCTDPVPECDNVCDKLLPCGCHCQFKCHSGECYCTTIFAITCSCGHDQYLAPCAYAHSGKRPKCHHKCSVLLSCRKHYHREECCDQERIGLERERARKKAIRNNLKTNVRDDIMSIEAAHICTQTCNRMKLCGVHECQAMCHSGPCEVCLESTNDDLVCNCGKTRIAAPVRCGTELVCHEQCVRPKECGHPPEIHECHPDDVSCPKCTYLVKKTCDCGSRDDLPGIMCSQERVSCGKMCMVAKECGHPCLRTCSAKCTKDGDHMKPKDCQNNCSKVRKNCPHLCKLKCHFDKVGKSANCDVVRCGEPVTIQCECGHLSRKVKCGASVNDASLIGTLIECDESCAVAKRDAQLRSAFRVDEVPDKDISVYSPLVLDTFAKQRKWCSKVEDTIRSFINDYNAQIENGVESPKRSFHFTAMTSPQRQFVHELGKLFGLYTESQDAEPKRATFIVITRLTKLPAVTIAEEVEMLELKAKEQSEVKKMTQEEIDDALFNAIVIQDLFFGVNKEDLERELLSNKREEKQNTNDEEQELTKSFRIQWTENSTFVLYNSENFKTMDVEAENKLWLIQDKIRKLLREKSLAFDCKLCLIDDSVNFILKVAKTSRVSSVEPVSEVKKTQDKNAFNVLQTDELVMQS
ncbi:conserved hypothetical protein [Lodderomyces elongisporus NRRL YB-4239]|uniref:R3H domain-containing protein n=1 Tax=Lodderomyces elongisporus (strain ATCC 11503 / CBS 2605 / JCM 1781 / NBRC 1676 / NRRL YB-4239) TaxID=379508 RepID=A5DRU3_LODEL|nr:conserved hypothetical protein [Lodderomyces elongisporus NRRL YB-4239]